MFESTQQSMKTPWLSITSMLVDLAFETDMHGRFTALGSRTVLGCSAAQMIGKSLAELIDLTELAENTLNPLDFEHVLSTVCNELVAWHGQMRLVNKIGQSSLCRVALAPRMIEGSVVGTYGVLLDLNAPDLNLISEDPNTNNPNRFVDSQTGLWNGMVFANELSRRFDRLDVENQPGTLLYLAFPHCSKKMRPAVAMRLTEELREIIRPTDMLGRIDETTIGLWCDGMDHLTGGERAAKFCTTLPGTMPEQTPLIISVAPRWAGTGDDASTIMEYATATLRLADLEGQRSGQTNAPSSIWRVWQSGASSAA